MVCFTDFIYRFHIVKERDHEKTIRYLLCIILTEMPFYLLNTVSWDRAIFNFSVSLAFEQSFGLERNNRGSVSQGMRYDENRIPLKGNKR